MLLLLASGGGGGGGSPGPLTFGSYVYNDGVNAISTTFTGLAIGPAASDRWVVAAISVHHDGARSLSTVTIGGVAATKLYSAPTLSFAGTTFEFWKANVPTGTTANVVVTDPAGIIYEGGCATYYCAGEPTFHAGAHDNTYTGNTFSVAINVPDGGAVIAAAFNDSAGALSSWAGVTADATDNTNWTYFASEDLLTVETGRTVSFTTTAQSSSTGFFGVGVVSLEIPAASGGVITATLGATEGADTAAFAASAAHTASLAATEGSDTASFALAARHTAALAATEGQDTASFALEARHTAALGATEGADAAAFAAEARHTADLAATEGQDTASFTIGDAAITASLSATEGADTAAFALSAAHTAALGATEGQDTAAFAVTVSGGEAPRPRGDDAFRSSGQRERFWRERIEEELEELLERAAQPAPRKARRRVVEAFALVEWEKLPEAPRTRDLLASLKSEQPDYTHIAALVLQIREQIEAERTRRRRKRDLEAVLMLA